MRLTMNSQKSSMRSLSLSCWIKFIAGSVLPTIASAFIWFFGFIYPVVTFVPAQVVFPEDNKIVMNGLVLSPVLVLAALAAWRICDLGNHNHERSTPMLYDTKNIKGYKLSGIDGEIGKESDFYFDDRHWSIRYLVADTGHWLKGKKVLIPSNALNIVEKIEQHISLKLTTKQIENSPPLDSDKPVSRQTERKAQEFCSIPTYASAAFGPTSIIATPGCKEENEHDQDKKSWDPNLRSMSDIRGFKLVARDGEFGCVTDFIIDDKDWMIRYLVVDTGDWWLGKKILISPQWIDKISWGDSMISVDFSCDTFMQVPEYLGEFMLTREYETLLSSNCSCQGYWCDLADHKKSLNC